MRIGSAGIAPGAIPATTARTTRPTRTRFTLDIVEPSQLAVCPPGVWRREATMARPLTRGQGIPTPRAEALCYHGAAMASVTPGVARTRERMAGALIVLAVAFAVATPATGVGDTQRPKMEASGRLSGRLLVAAESLRDPRFQRT